MPRNTPLVFVSSSPFDLKHEEGHLRSLLRRLADEVNSLTAKPVEWRFDRRELSTGGPWEEELVTELEDASFMVAVVTPKFLQSSWCRRELKAFRKREAEAGAEPRILPILYLGDDERLKEGMQRLELADRQAEDWRDLRFNPFSSGASHQKLHQTAERVAKALQS